MNVLTIKTVLLITFAISFSTSTSYAATPKTQTKTTPSTPNKSQFIKTELDRLFKRLAKATNEKQGRAIENQIWQTWMSQPNAEVQSLISDAMKARRWYDFAKAKKLLDKAIKLAPNYAEGYNQRAFILFLQEKFDESLSDTEKAIELEPRHFGALSGQALILMRQGRFSTGQKILKRAIKIHPFLKERSMIIDTGEKDI